MKNVYWRLIHSTRDNAIRIQKLKDKNHDNLPDNIWKNEKKSRRQKEY